MIRKFITIIILLLSCLLQNSSALAVQQVGSSSWSGVIDNGSGLTRAYGTVTVPAVSSYCGSNSEAAVWVGLGGYGSYPLAQLGITLTPHGYGAWYELLNMQANGPEADIPVPMKAGDKMRLDIQFNGASLTLRWHNLTSGVDVRKVVANASQYHSTKTAEWIVERSHGVSANSNFVRFSPVQFTSMQKGTATTLNSALPATYLSNVISTAPKQYGNSTAIHTSASSATTNWLSCR